MPARVLVQRDVARQLVWRNGEKAIAAAACLPNGSAFSGVRQSGTALLNTWVHAILPRAMDLKRSHVRCNGSHDECVVEVERSTGSSCCLPTFHQESGDRQRLGPSRDR